MAINAYAAYEPGGEFQHFSYDPGELGPHDVEIDVHSCGVCHSDVSMWKNEWGIAEYPFVGGHEIAGVVTSTGSLVDNVKVGDKVGLGWQKGYCNSCNQCLGGDHNLCTKQQGTIIGHHGGFAERVRAQDTSVIKIPQSFDLSLVGPLLCGGITVFNPLVQNDIKPTSKVAVIGIGGLGHLALQFARAWGCEVTAFTSKSKMEEAKQLGAHHCLDSRNPDAIADAQSRFDLIISTVNVAMDWNAIVATLKPKGRLHFVGIVEKPLEIEALPMIMQQISISGSPVGSPATLNTMMEFAARHDIRPVTETFKFEEINQAFEHLESGKARYRIVLVK
ncbi:NADPH-dependent aldehyde reductase Ahr [Marinobacter xestospongiae]|uniref:NAD(P)-dependent alcohol dehydrogenase n=1 Tax=Marinobacter xestospongiae TaxID=994319 RepID=A0ABU3W033_9GAMM|nr:NAD(P)-dependent alcohol dehydrogenase [Marinobacter xestospongiae]MDV2079903.1 NAD(P)-dependent alcohol dehydrogenase [Marinobacter xestospongiae]